MGENESIVKNGPFLKNNNNKNQVVGPKGGGRGDMN